MSKRLRFLVLVLAGASAVLFVFLWRSESLPFARKTFRSAAYHFSFQYPAHWNSTCCVLYGPVSPTSEYVIAIADPGTVGANADMPFDGLTVYVDPNPSGQPFQRYLAHEQDDLYAMRLGLGWRSFPIDTRMALAPQTGRTNKYVLNGREGVLLYDFMNDDVSRIYIPFPDERHVLILAARLGFDSEWDAAVGKILATFKFE